MPQVVPLPSFRENEYCASDHPSTHSPMHRLNKHTIVLTILYLLLTALLIHTIVFLLLKYFSSLAKLISWGVALALDLTVTTPSTYITIKPTLSALVT